MTPSVFWLHSNVICHPCMRHDGTKWQSKCIVWFFEIARLCHRELLELPYGLEGRMESPSCVFFRMIGPSKVYFSTWSACISYFYISAPKHDTMEFVCPLKSLDNEVMESLISFSFWLEYLYDDQSFIRLLLLFPLLFHVTNSCCLLICSMLISRMSLSKTPSHHY